MANQSDGFVFEKNFYAKQTTADEYSRSHAVVLGWAASHAGAITLAITAAAFLIGFGWYCYLCGRAIAFGIPIDEVPTPDTIYIVLLYAAIALVFLPTNIAIYRAMNEADDYKAQTMIVLTRCIWCYVFTLGFVVIVGFLRGTVLGSDDTSFVYVACYYFGVSLILFIPILLLSSAVGVIQAVSMNRVSKRPQRDDNKRLTDGVSNLESTDAEKPVSTILNHFGRRILAITVAISVTAVLLLFLGIAYARCLNGAMVANAKDDPSQDYAVVFSSGDLLCVQRCCIKDDAIWVDVSSFEWVSKTGMEMRSLPNCSVQTVSKVSVAESGG